MSYSEIVQRCFADPMFFLASLIWVAFFVGFAFSLGGSFFRWLRQRMKRP